MDDYRRGGVDLLSTYAHHSELQVITAPPLIYTLYESLPAMSSSAYSVFASCCLVRAPNNRDSSASRTHVISRLYSTELSTQLEHHLFSASLAELN
jgi:hypothetical protein